MSKFFTRRALALLLAVAMTAMLFAGCASSQTTDTTSTTTTTASADAKTSSENTTEATASVTESAVPVNSNGTFESNDGLVTRMNLVQVMASGIDASNGGLFDMFQFVAGKESLVYAEFSETLPVSQDGSMVVTISRDGTDLIQLTPSMEGDSTEAYFIPRNIADVGNWEAGDYTITFNYGDSVATRTVTLNEAKKIKVLAVPVIANYGGNVVSCEGEWKTAIQFTRDCYPLAADGIEYVLGSELDLSDSMYDLTTDEGGYYVWQALCQLQTPNNDYELILGFVRDRQGADGTLQGFTYGSPANIITESDGDMQPTVAHEIAHCYNVGDEYPGGTINNRVNPAPYGMEGSDWVNRDETVAGDKIAIKTAQEYGNNNSGSILLPEEKAINVTSRSLMTGSGSFMGSGSDQMTDYWITSDIWNQLYKAFVYGDSTYPDEYASPAEGTPIDSAETSDASAETADTEESTDESASDDEAAAEDTSNMLVCPSCGEQSAYADIQFYAQCADCGELTAIDKDASPETFVCSSCEVEGEITSDNVYAQCPLCGELTAPGEWSAPAKTSRADADATVTAIDITGRVTDGDVFTVSPWFSYETEASGIVLPDSSDFAVEMFDASGASLGKQNIEVSFWSQSNPPVKRAYAAVNATVELYKGTARIALLHSDKEIYSVDVSANAPTVDFTGITENQEYSGKQTISWSGSDADGDALSYELWYCAAEDDYYAVASGITGTSYEVDFDTLPGSDAGYFYIYATDGVNTTGKDSPWVKVGYKAPEVITAQPTTSEYKLTDEIVFTSDVYDMQDGWLWTSDEINWTLNGVDYLSGDTLIVYPFELAPGKHTFTMTATNSAGLTSSMDYTFTIIDDESALPNDWSKEDVKKALSNGFIAPLKNVNAAITRSKFADLMANLYWMVSGEDAVAPEYEENVVTDCGADDYAQFLMVKLGVMEAPDGKFNPNGNVTEEEAAVIMYQICALGNPEVAEPTDDRDTMVQTCINSAVMDETGDNIYSADAKITGRLALVRCNRLYEAIFE